MKNLNLVFLFLFLILIVNKSYSQNKYQIGISGGVVITSFEFNDDMGFGTLASLSYEPVKSISLYLSSGILTWNSISTYRNIYNTRITPIILGAKYFFYTDKFAPYILFEIEQIYGKRLKGFYGLKNIYPYELPGYKEYITDSVTMNDIIFAGGLGFKYNLGKKINFETASVISLFSNHESTDGFHIRVFTGFNYMF